MSQILGVGEGKYITFDRSWRDNGKDATYAVYGGQKVLVEPGTKAKPEIYQRGEGFYYKDGSPVAEMEHVNWLPKKHREMAEKFIKSNEAPERLAPVASREEAVVQAVKRGRGRPKKAEAPAKLEIKDAATLKALGGEDI